VLLVDADLRRPAVATALGLEGAVGLTNLLLDDARLEDVVQTWGAEERLKVLASGPIPANPSELLGFERTRQVVDDLVARYQLVIFDSPPVLPVTDAAVLAQMLDGVILVMRVRATRRDRLRRTVERLSQLNLRLIGLVANGTPRVDESYAKYQMGRHRPDEPAAIPPASEAPTSTAVD
jgi:non-specific protein-tyrosine kinase